MDHRITTNVCTVPWAPSLTGGVCAPLNDTLPSQISSTTARFSLVNSFLSPGNRFICAYPPHPITPISFSLPPRLPRHATVVFPWFLLGALILSGGCLQVSETPQSPQPRFDASVDTPPPPPPMRTPSDVFNHNIFPDNASIRLTFISDSTCLVYDVTRPQLPENFPDSGLLRFSTRATPAILGGYDPAFRPMSMTSDAGVLRGDRYTNGQLSGAYRRENEILVDGTLLPVRGPDGRLIGAQLILRFSPNDMRFSEQGLFTPLVYSRPDGGVDAGTQGCPMTINNVRNSFNEMNYFNPMGFVGVSFGIVTFGRSDREMQIGSGVLSRVCDADAGVANCEAGTDAGLPGNWTVSLVTRPITNPSDGGVTDVPPVRDATRDTSSPRDVAADVSARDSSATDSPTDTSRSDLPSDVIADAGRADAGTPDASPDAPARVD